MRKKIINLVVNLSSIILLVPLFILRYPFKIKFWRMRNSRLGHLARNNELFLRRQKLNLDNRTGKKINPEKSQKQKELKHYGISTKEVANKQLLRMIKRKIKTIQIPQTNLVRHFLKKLSNSSILSKCGLFNELPYNITEYYEWDNGERSFHFNSKEEVNGQKMLDWMKVDKWFVCFHARDSTYLDKMWKKGDSYHGYRNCKIQNQFKAMEYVTEKEGFSIRMGAKVDVPLENNSNKKIIDYANKFRGDFGDIYLISKCKFFVGSNSGIFDTAKIFNIPAAIVNMIPYNSFPQQSHDLFIPKKLWSLDKKRLLSFKEIFNSEIIDYNSAKKYRDAKIELIENTPEEILALVNEMNERIDGTWFTTEKDKELQKKFKSLIGPKSRYYNFPSRIGAQFLRDNESLFN